MTLKSQLQKLFQCSSQDEHQASLQKAKRSNHCVAQNPLLRAEVDHITDLFKRLVECHNLHLDEHNLDQLNKDPTITLIEKCNLCDFSSNTTRGPRGQHSQEQKATTKDLRRKPSKNEICAISQVSNDQTEGGPGMECIEQ